MKNLTPHPITFCLPTADGKAYFDVTFPPSGTIARVAVERLPGPDVWVTLPDGRVVPVPTTTEWHGRLEGWTPADGPAIVSRMALAAAPAGAPLFAPDTGAGALRDDEGRVFAVSGLISAEDPLRETTKTDR